MKANLSSLVRHTGTLTGLLLVCAGAPARGADKAPPADAFPNFDSYIKISGQAAEITGNDSAFMNRTGQTTGGAGIEDLHISKDVSKTTTVILDGRALTGSEDYLGRFNVTKNEVGSFDIGYKRFRTFYDGAGGFFPLNNQWTALANEDLHIDRAKFWAEATLNLPNAPVITVRYTNELRDGRKDSTIWGDSDFTGLPFNAAPVAITPARKFAPSYLQIGERHERAELTAKHTVGKTTVELTLFGDRTNNLDNRFVARFPGEVIPWSIAGLATAAQPAAKAAVGPANWNNQVLLTQTDGSNTKTSGATAASDTVLNDKLTLKFAANYELMHATMLGDRTLVTSTPTATGVVPVVTDQNAALLGGNHVKDAVGSIALDFHPTKTIFVKLAWRAQEEYIRSTATFNVIAASGTPATTTATTPRIDWSKVHEKTQTPVLELRYTGIRDLALYATGSKRDQNGVESYNTAYNPITALAGTLANNNVSENHGDYTFGANWKASQLLSIRAEVYDKGHKDDSVGYGPRVGDYYLLDSRNTGAKLTVIAKPTVMLSFTTRVVDQRSKMQVTGYLPTFPAYDSLNGKNYMIGETIDWTPSTACYVQLNANATYNVISTVYPRAGQTAPTATVNGFDDNKIVQNSDNNYVSGSLLTGFVVDKATDLEVQANYYKANNGDPLLTALTTPYGVAVRDVSLTVGVKHKFSDRWVGHAKLGYFKSDNDTSGGFASYHGPIGFVSLDYGL